jgi:hypothetical protein
MLSFLILAVLFGFGFIVNVMDEATDWVEASACLAITLVMTGMLLWMRISHSRSEKTIAWLLQNKDQITDEAHYFREGPIFDHLISKKTPLKSYKVVTSILILTSESELGLEIRKGPWACLMATTWTLLFGWWGFPWGPIRTIRALHHNLSGGKSMSVASVILTAETGWDFERGERL